MSVTLCVCVCRRVKTSEHCVRGDGWVVVGGGEGCYHCRRSVLASPRYRYRPPPLWHEGRKMISGTGDNGGRDLRPCPGAAPLSGTAAFRSREKEERRRTKELLFFSSYFKTLDVFFRSAERGGASPTDFPPSVPPSPRPSVRLSGNHQGKDESFTGFTGKRLFRSHSSFAHGSHLLFPDRQEEKSER